jgi:hypothetical protein
MTDAVNTVAGGVAVTAVAPAQPDRVPAANADSATKLSAPAQLSSRFYDDPLAGIVVTEQLDSQGQVVSQNPPGAVLAYLRNGLTVDGQVKQTTTA